tara:strand:- start:199 stop:1173 length:975 start_codon:yes stop_codon:yes gene_type:complete
MFLSIIGGIIALGIGADLIVRAAINLANVYKVSGYFIGFTVIALGTSLPELAATVQALNVVNSLDIALGNIIGSNIANILLILGVVSIINPIIFPDKQSQRNQTVIVLVVTLIATIIFYILSNSSKNNTGIYGIILILIFLAFLFLQYKNEILDKTQIISQPQYSKLLSYIILIVGLILLYYGSKYFIVGSKYFALSFGISESIIGLTLVAFGTSLPELATGIVAATRKQSNIAVGTILGSNVYNIVGIFALILFVKSSAFPSGSGILIINILLMLIITFLFVYKVRFGFKFFNILPFHLGKKSGILFLILYVIYNLYNYFMLN